MELSSPAVGDPAPALALPLLDGSGSVRLEDLRERALILTFLRHAG
ncbi:MAG: hypothetical protein NVSMB25_08490 [Thermoleophilaceae bacterium]